MTAAWMEMFGGKLPSKKHVSTSNPLIRPGIPTKTKLYLKDVLNIIRHEAIPNLMIHQS